MNHHYIKTSFMVFWRQDILMFHTNELIFNFQTFPFFHSLFIWLFISVSFIVILASLGLRTWTPLCVLICTVRMGRKSPTSVRSDAVFSCHVYLICTDSKRMFGWILKEKKRQHVFSAFSFCFLLHFCANVDKEMMNESRRTNCSEWKLYRF